MGIEGGPSSAIGGGVAASVGTATGGPEAPSLGGIRGGIAALEATVPLAGIGSSIVNEGPVRGSLEGFRPMNTSDINTIDQGGTIAPGRPPVIEQAAEAAAKAWDASETLDAKEVVSQAEAIIAQAAVIPNVIPTNVLRSRDPQDRGAGIQLKIQAEEKLLDPRLRGDDSKVVMSQAEPVVLPWVEPALALQVSPAPLPQPILQEQEVEEEVLMEGKVERSTGSLEEEEMVEQRMYVEDEEASAQRRYEIETAVKKAETEKDRWGLGKITGWLVSKFLPAEHIGNRSQVVMEKGPDGSYQETVEAIASSGEFGSEEQAEKRFTEIVADKKPVKNGKEGSPVKNEDVARVFKYHIVKPATSTYEIVTKRIKKKVPVPAGQVAQTQTEAGVETSLEDYPDLAEVFQKAA